MLYKTSEVIINRSYKYTAFKGTFAPTAPALQGQERTAFPLPPYFDVPCHVLSDS